MRSFLVVLLLCPIVASAGTPDAGHDSTSVDTTHSVSKATLLSAIVPGAGQIYNHLAMPKGKKKAFWKVPLILGGLGATTYFLVRNEKERKMLKSEYEFRQNDPGYVPGFAFPDKDYQLFDSQGILTLYDQFSRWRDFSMLGLGAVYLVQVADAAVEAHFVSFDVSEDLSMSIQPTAVCGLKPGIRLQFKFR